MNGPKVITLRVFDKKFTIFLAPDIDCWSGVREMNFLNYVCQYWTVQVVERTQNIFHFGSKFIWGEGNVKHISIRQKDKNKSCFCGCVKIVSCIFKVIHGMGIIVNVKPTCIINKMLRNSGVGEKPDDSKPRCCGFISYTRWNVSKVYQLVFYMNKREIKVVK